MDTLNLTMVFLVIGALTLSGDELTTWCNWLIGINIFLLILELVIIEYNFKKRWGEFCILTFLNKKK